MFMNTKKKKNSDTYFDYFKSRCCYILIVLNFKSMCLLNRIPMKQLYMKKKEKDKT